MSFGKILKNMTITAILFTFNLSVTMAFAADTAVNDEKTINAKIASIGFNKKVEDNNTEKITELFEKSDKYASKKDIRGLKKLYDTSFINNDNIDYNEFFVQIKENLDSFKNVKITTKINSIDCNSDYATVFVTEFAKAETKDEEPTLHDTGDMKSITKSYYYLQKIQKKWKITGTEIISESYTISYGDGKKFSLFMKTPGMLKSGSEYTAKLSTDIDEGYIVSGAITSTPIKRPLELQNNEIYKLINPDFDFERVMHANNLDYNEYVIGLIGYAQAIPAEDNEKFSLKVTGMSYIVNRINILTQKNPEKTSNSK